MAQSQRYPSIDALKLFLSFLVVCIHFPFPFFWGWAVKVLAKIAVSLFFMISGFFMYHPDAVTVKRKARKAIPRILAIACLSSLLYLAVGIVQSYTGESTGGIVHFFSKLCSLRVIVKLIVFNVPLAGTPLWYLFAYLYVLIFYYWGASFVLKHRGVTISLSVGLLLVFAIYDAYSVKLFGNISAFGIHDLTGNSIFVRNAYFDGLPFFTLGFWFKERMRDDSFQGKTPILIVCALAFYALSLWEHTFIGKSAEISFGTILLSICVFILTVKHRNLFSRTILPKLGRLYSLYIYIFHSVVALAFMLVFEKMDIFSGVRPVYILLKPVLIFSVSLLGSMVYVKAKERLLPGKP